MEEVKEKVKFTKIQLEIIKRYRDLINNPMADGYTWVAFRNEYELKDGEAEKLYEEYKTRKKLVNLTKRKAFDLIAKEIEAYKERSRFNCAIFPKKEIMEIVASVKKEEL